MTEIINLIRSIIGQPIASSSTTSITVDGLGNTVTSIVAVGYDLEYILAACLLVLFNVGIFILLINFQKSFSRRTK